MGSSGDTINKGIDASVGGLVWVRRRNGSWWPGRIVGLNELSEGCLVSPRSGTPVKLLGREDASVDWYNLEKSKRVKAFRCGEYDECIEKAKASAANLNKKAVKYARRDDAILHALEIENARLGKGHLDLRTRIDSSVGDHDNTSRESPSVSLSCDKNDGTNDDVSDTEGNSDSAQELSRSGISFEEPNLINSSKVQSMQGRRRRTPNDSEDDGTGIKRMRGLEDLGVGVVSKKKLQSGVLLDLVQQNQVSLSDPKNVNSLSDGSAVNGIKGNSSLKRKRTQVAHVHEFLKRKNRRRPLTKVLESTAMLSVPVICDNLPSSRGSPLRGLSDCKAFELESIESKKTLSSVINNNSDCTGASCENGTSLTASGQICDASHNNHKEKENEHSSASADNASSEKLFDVPFLGEEKHPAGLSPLYVPCSSGRPQISELRRQSSQNGQAEAASLRNDGTNELGSTSSVAVPVNVDQRIETGTSKWQLKGKRNSRQIIKDRKHESRKHLDIDDESNVYLSCIEQPDGSDQKADCNVIGGPSNLYHCSLEAKSKPVADEQADGHQDWSRYLSQREPNIRGGPMTDVKLDDSLVPQRSLPHRQSRFTVPSRYQMPDFSIRKFCSDALLYDVKLEVKANYRPQHVPLVSLMSKLNGKAIVGHPLTVEVLDDGSCDINFSKMEYNLEDGEVGYTRPKSIGGRILTKHLYMQTRHSPSKSPKTKKSGFLQKKIRKLSSLTGQKQSEERKALAKKLKGPVIACVPLKLVFSRINEAVNGSARQTNRVLTPRHLK